MTDGRGATRPDNGWRGWRRRLPVLALVRPALGVGYTRAMARLAPGTPPPMAAPAERVDTLRVVKSARAAVAGVPPGGDIVIHGRPDRRGLVGDLHLLWGWTNGCIAVTNAEMREIWSLVPDGTPILIEG